MFCTSTEETNGNFWEWCCDPVLFCRFPMDLRRKCSQWTAPVQSLHSQQKFQPDQRSGHTLSPIPAPADGEKWIWITTSICLWHSLVNPVQAPPLPPHFHLISFRDPPRCGSFFHVVIFYVPCTLCFWACVWVWGAELQIRPIMWVFLTYLCGWRSNVVLKFRVFSCVWMGSLCRQVIKKIQYIVAKHSQVHHILHKGVWLWVSGILDSVRSLDK